MRAFTKKSKGNPKQFAFELAVGLGVVAVLAAVVYPVFQPGSRCYIRLNCHSNLKQLGTAVAIYQSDFDDRLPPYFTFDGPEKTQQFINATMPYAKSESIYMCLHDKDRPVHSGEGSSRKMSFVHALGMKRSIPRFDLGNRTLRVPEVAAELASTVYMRDPIQGFGTSAIIGGESSEPAYLSLHGSLFLLLYLDTHVKAKKNVLDISEL